MANEFIISRVTTLPVPLVANTMYIVKVPGTEIAELVFVGNDVSTVAKTITYEQVGDMVTDAVAEAMEAGKSVFVVETIGERDAIAPTKPVIAYVKNTSSDPLAPATPGVYLFDDTMNQWLTMPGGNGNVKWTDISGGPSSSPASIDAAVAASVHANRAVLDKLGETGGELTYNGQPVGGVIVVPGW